jgi:hypothetical protein
MGYFRLSLALAIMAAHASAIPIVWAKGAVLVFYSLAGYMAAASMAWAYQGRPVAFLASRWLRVWPCYAVVFVGALLWLLWRGVPPVGLALGMPSIPWLLAQFAMIPTPVTVGLIVPPSWMLPWLFLGWGLIAIAPRFSGRAMLGLGLPWFVVAPNYYGSALGLWWMGLGAVAYRGGVVLPRDGHWSAWAGVLSFPLYLVHAAVLGEASFWVPTGWPLFFAALGPTLALSWLLVVTVERPAQKFRSSLRNKPNVSI